MSQLKKVFEEADEKYRMLTKIPEEFLSIPHEFKKRSEKLIITYKTECSVSESKHNGSLAACLETKEKNIKEVNNDTKEKIQDLRDQRNGELKISRKNIVKKLTKQQDLVFSLGVMILAIILVLAGLVGLGFIIAGLEGLADSKSSESEFFSIFMRKGGIQLVITIIFLSGLIFIYIRKILLFNSHKELINSYSAGSSDKDVTSADTDTYCQEKKPEMNADFNKPSIPTPTTSLPLPLTSDSNSEEAQRVYEQGIRMFEDGQKQEALEAFLKATDIDPNCVDACVALARCFHAIDAEKYSDQVMQFAEQAFKAAPNNHKARNILSVAHFKKGKMAWDAKNWQEATLCFKRSYQIEPSQQTLAGFGYCAENADELGTFADVCEARLKEQSDDHGARFMLGRTFVNMAIKDLSEPDKTLRNTEYLRRAEEQLTTFLASDPVSADGNYWMGVIFSMTGRLDEAANNVIKLKDIDPEKSKDLADLIHVPATGSWVDRDPDSIPVAELMSICKLYPKEGITLVDRMSRESQQTDHIVLAKLVAYQTLATKPFIEAKMSLSSNSEEFMRYSQSDTIELCENAIEQITKIESGNADFKIWKKDEFEDSDLTPKQRADAVCTILDSLQPGRVQEIRGRTRLSYFGETRIGSVPGLNLNEIVGSESISRLQDILFEFPEVIRSVIAFEVKEKVVNGAKIVCCRVFDQVTSKRPEEDPGQCLGILNLCVDGTCSYEVS